jgi:hypothetical protein
LEPHQRAILSAISSTITSVEVMASKITIDDLTADHNC